MPTRKGSTWQDLSELQTTSWCDSIASSYKGVSHLLNFMLFHPMCVIFSKGSPLRLGLRGQNWIKQRGAIPCLELFLKAKLVLFVRFATFICSCLLILVYVMLFLLSLLLLFFFLSLFVFVYMYIVELLCQRAPGALEPSLGIVPSPCFRNMEREKGATEAGSQVVQTQSLL